MSLWVPPTVRNDSSGAPEDFGLLAWTFDMANAGTSQIITTAGTLQGARLYLGKAATVTNLCAYLQTAGATLTAGQNKGALYNSAGTLLGTTVDQATAWTSTGFKTMALATPVLCPAGLYDIVVWYNGTTAPSFSRSAGIALVQGPSSGQNLRYFNTNDTGKTTAAPSTLGTKTAVNFGWWFGLS